MSGVTSDTAAREFDSHREEAEDMAMYRPGSLVDRYVEAMEQNEALLSELATARRERDDAMRGRDDLPMAHNILAQLKKAEAELVVVRRQLAEADELFLRIFDELDIAERTNGGDPYALLPVLREHLVARGRLVRAVLGGQETPKR